MVTFSLFVMKTGIQKRKLQTLYFLLVFSMCIMIWNLYNKLQKPSIAKDLEINKHHNIGRFLINTSQCKIPQTDPYSHDIRKFLRKENYIHCRKLPLLSYVRNKGCNQFLHINQTLTLKYSSFGLSCCYYNINRMIDSKNFDDDLIYSQCIHFKSKVLITSRTVLVKCNNFFGIKVYENVHSIINPNCIRKNLSDARAPSVLVFGIDSMSQSNLIRTMPKTVKFLEETGFIKLKGYTKVGDNTYPNLIPIMTGKTKNQFYESCNPQEEPMDHCELIWKDFNKLNYVTAYAEDVTVVGMFNFYRQGFRKPPTDFYFRPYFMATERNLFAKKLDEWSYCTGPENAAQRVINTAKDFVWGFEGRAKFGWFWTCSFSHGNINRASAMDETFLDFFNDIKEKLDNTIFIFFSDHGFRIGEIRDTYTGWIEERLPFVYIYIPDSIRKQYPEKYSNLQINSERLTSPFDLYITLQDILSLSKQNYSIRQSEGCRTCHSLFQEVAENRSCTDAAITKNWCLCSADSLLIEPETKIIKDISEFVVSEINTILSKDEDGGKCSKFSLRTVLFSSISHSNRNEKNQLVNYYTVSIATLPPAKFAATVEVLGNSFRTVGDISRTNKYAKDTQCIQSLLEKYCYCKNILTSFKMFLGVDF